jgi:hypothetical protein
MMTVVVTLCVVVVFAQAHALLSVRLKLHAHTQAMGLRCN